MVIKAHASATLQYETAIIKFNLVSAHVIFYYYYFIWDSAC